jgi:hypothetical protein
MTPEKNHNVVSIQARRDQQAFERIHARRMRERTAEQQRYRAGVAVLVFVSLLILWVVV